MLDLQSSLTLSSAHPQSANELFLLHCVVYPYPAVPPSFVWMKIHFNNKLWEILRRFELTSQHVPHEFPLFHDNELFTESRRRSTCSARSVAQKLRAGTNWEGPKHPKPQADSRLGSPKRTFSPTNCTADTFDTHGSGQTKTDDPLWQLVALAAGTGGPWAQQAVVLGKAGLCRRIRVPATLTSHCMIQIWRLCFDVRTLAIGGLQHGLSWSVLHKLLQHSL